MKEEAKKEEAKKDEKAEEVGICRLVSAAASTSLCRICLVNFRDQSNQIDRSSIDRSIF